MLWNSSDGDDQRIFLGRKILWLDLSREFVGGIQNNLKIEEHG